MIQSQYRFTLRDVRIGVAAIGLLLLLALPAVRAAQEAARRNRCMGNLKQLAIALHNYHNIHKQFPNVTSTEIRGVAPASISTKGNPGAGYHWLVSILPYLHEKKATMKWNKPVEASDFLRLIRP
jgi:hypothetical protein